MEFIDSVCDVKEDGVRKRDRKMVILFLSDPQFCKSRPYGDHLPARCNLGTGPEAPA
ncbi:hypothetical protein [Streptomyces sp. NPDC058307]|uniref:hypothetical protein n=1 Tax=Streptomyces sp. NPDC058307 TaxID=3346439 RepID=UPI0036F06729